jgi:hypothetical protein
MPCSATAIPRRAELAVMESSRRTNAEQAEWTVRGTMRNRGSRFVSASKLGLVSSLAPGCARIFWSVSEHETTPDTTIGTLATTVFSEVQRWRGRNQCSRMFDIGWPQPPSCRISAGTACIRRKGKPAIDISNLHLQHLKPVFEAQHSPSLPFFLTAGRPPSIIS